MLKKSKHTQNCPELFLSKEANPTGSQDPKRRVGKQWQVFHQALRKIVWGSKQNQNQECLNECLEPIIKGPLTVSEAERDLNIIGPGAQGWRKCKAGGLSPLTLLLWRKTLGSPSSQTAFEADRSKLVYHIQQRECTECSCLNWQMRCG